MKYTKKIIKKIIKLICGILGLLFALILFLLSLFIILFSFKKEKILTFASQYAEEFLLKEFQITAHIPKPEFEIKGYKAYLSLPFVNLKGENEIIDLKEINLELNYLRLLMLKIKLMGEVKNLKITFLKEENNEEKEFFDIGAFFSQIKIFFLKSINIHIQNTALLFVDPYQKVDFVFKDASFEFYSKNKIILDAYLKANLKLPEGKNLSEIIIYCNLYEKNQFCNFNFFNFKRYQLEKMNDIIHTIKTDDYFEFVDGEINHFLLNFEVEKGRVKDIRGTIDMEDFEFKSKFLKFKQDTRFHKLLVNIHRKNITNKDVTNISFNAFLENDTKKEINGFIELAEEAVTVNVFANNLTTDDLKSYWPKEYLANVSDWLDGALYDSIIPQVFVHVKTPMKDKNDLIVNVAMDRANLHYSDGLPDVKNIKGTVLVNNTNNVVVNIESATYGEMEIMKNGLAIFDTKQDKLFLDIKLKGDFSSIFNIFVSNKNFQNKAKQVLQGDSILDLKLNLPILEDADATFKSADYVGSLSSSNFINPLTKGDEVNFIIQKKAGENTSLIKLVSSKNLNLNGACLALISDFSLNLGLDLTSHLLSLNNIQINGNNLSINGDLDLDYSDSPTLNVRLNEAEFCENNFSAIFNQSSEDIVIKGKHLNYQEIKSLELYSFISNLQSNENRKWLSYYNILIDIESAKLLNDVKLFNILFSFKTIEFFEIKSNLIHGYRKKQDIFIEAPNIGLLIQGFTGFSGLKNGFLTIKAKKGKKDEIRGILSVKNYDLKVGKLNLGTKEAKTNFTIDDTFVYIQDLIISNPINTLAVNGKVKKDDLSLDLEANYTLSSLHINKYLDILPTDYASKLFNLITFNTLKDGFLTLTYDIDGDINKPVIVFRGLETSKKFIVKSGKIIFAVFILNLFLLPLLVF